LPALSNLRRRHIIDLRDRQGIAMAVELDSVEEAIAAIAGGELVIVVDDADRENEGDLIMAAAKALPEQVAFMIRHTSGILCAPLPPEEARRLRLDPMVAQNDAPLGTAFTVSVDYRVGLTTGISAEERSQTVRALANANAGAEDFVRPGHIFPLIGRAGGVLVRTGHTEAAIDLARLAGLPPVGLLAELVNDDGTVKRLPQLRAFAARHRLKMISVADLVAHRQQREQLIERVGAFEVLTEAGPARAIAYATPFDSVHHLALIVGDLEASASGAGEVLVRIQREEVIEDVFARRDGPSVSRIPQVLERIRAQGRGVLIYLREGTVGVPIGRHEECAAAEPAASAAQARGRQWHDVGIGAQILRDLGITRITLLATGHRRYVGLSGFGIDIAATELLDG
jgi:3,4-dihydroxy 2-butanone 4-phosphate synthase/GTP cyclohydrolase II